MGADTFIAFYGIKLAISRTDERNTYGPSNTARAATWPARVLGPPDRRKRLLSLYRPPDWLAGS